MIYRFDQPKCLNGWWDLCPIYESEYPHNRIPEEGWYEGQYLVPSYYNKPGDGIMYGKDEFFHPSGLTLEQFTSPECKNLFDTFRYPSEWHRAKAVWVRRTLSVEKQAGKRYFLIFEALGPKAWIYLNGRNIKLCREYMLPQKIDVTEYLTERDNTLCVLLENYDKSDTGRHLWPSGNFITGGLYGIWQDVYLVEKNEVYLEDVTVVTSVREQKLSLRYVLRNEGQTVRTVTLTPETKGWKDGISGAVPAPVTVTVPAFDESTVTIETKWENPELWDSFHPYLYRLTTTLTEGEETVDVMTERFGFREIWLSGKHVMINGHPLHLFADWGHTVTCFSCVKEWIEKWFSMMRDYHLNASRLHTHPHPKLVMDLADEWGIYIIGETGAHGSGGMQASSTAEYWENLSGHISAFIKRDKNNPSVVMWSCANEMRWGCDADDHTLRVELDRIRRQFRREDPTRPAYHEGDTSLWNEKDLEIISRHYEKETSGMGWWDQTQPLHCGEMGAFHYAGPNSGIQFAGDRGFADYADVNRSVANASAWIVEDGRSLGVCCLGQWNISGLMNLRRNEEHEFTYEDYTVPGMKPLYAHEGASEFEFWNPGKGYWTQPGWELIRDAYRPFAALDLSRKTGFLAGRTTVKKLCLANDIDFDAEGTVTAGFVKDGRMLCAGRAKFSVRRGETEQVEILIPPCPPEGRCELFVTAVTTTGRVLDDWKKEVFVELPVSVQLKPSTAVAVIGSGYLRGFLERSGVNASYVEETDDLSAYRILVLEKNAVTEGSHLNRVVLEFAKRGGRVVVFEQQISLFPGLILEPKQMQTAFFRASEHPVLAGIDERELRFWSDDPFSLLSGDDYVTTYMYLKDDGSYMVPLLDAGESGFGSGDLNSTPLFEAQEGRGLILSCQMNVTDRRNEIPAASKLIRNLLSYAEAWKPKRAEAPVKTVVAPKSERQVASLLEFAKEGGNAVILRCDKNTVRQIAKTVGVRLSTAVEHLGTWNAIKHEEAEWNRGVSNEDLCGVERFTYCKGDRRDRTISEFVIHPNKKLHPLIETSPESCIYSMWPGYGRTELLRTRTAAEFCYGEPHVHEVLAGWIAYGKGRVYLSVFDPKTDDRPAFHRFENQLCRFLGANMRKGKQSPLEGEAVVNTNPAGKGFPEVAYFYRNPLTKEEFEEKLSLCTYQTERMIYSPILFDGSFEEVECSDGVYTAQGLTEGSPILMYYRLISPVVRKNFGSVDAIPDPGAQTFLDVTGEGEIELYINKRHCGHLNLTGDSASTLPDLELESGLNHILIVWKPKDAASTIRTLWRNIIRHPETGFQFTKPIQW